MIKTIKIKISPDNWQSSRPVGRFPDDYYKPLPSPIFELNINRSDFFKNFYSWSCLPGYLNAVSGSARFEDWGNSVFGLSSASGNAHCYGILYNLPTDFNLGSRGEATIDYGGYWLKKRLEGSKNMLEMLQEIFKKSDLTIHSKWEIINAF